VDSFLITTTDLERCPTPSALDRSVASHLVRIPSALLPPSQVALSRPNRRGGESRVITGLRRTKRRRLGVHLPEPRSKMKPCGDGRENDAVFDPPTSKEVDDQNTLAIFGCCVPRVRGKDRSMWRPREANSREVAALSYGRCRRERCGLRLWHGGGGLWSHAERKPAHKEERQRRQRVSTDSFCVFVFWERSPQTRCSCWQGWVSRSVLVCWRSPAVELAEGEPKLDNSHAHPQTHTRSHQRRHPWI
jgi:hypothetical protein